MSAYRNLIKRPASDMTLLESHIRYSSLKTYETREKAAENLAEIKRALIQLHEIVGETGLLNMTLLVRENVRHILDVLDAKG